MIRRASICATLIAFAMLVEIAAQPSTKADLYLVGIGKVPAGLVDELAGHFQSTFGIPIKSLPTIGWDRLAYDDERGQMVADRLIQAMRFRHPTLVKNVRTRMIGVTDADMYMAEMRDRWQFTFSLRSDDQRLAVVSYARMDPKALGAPDDDGLMRSRLRKMIAKNIGIMYFGLRTNDNPRSALFGKVLGVDDLDKMTEDFAPR